MNPSSPPLDESRPTPRTLLVIGSGREAYRGYALRAMKETASRILLLTDTEPTWERSCVARVVVADLDQPEAVATRIARLHAEDPIGGIFTYVETRVELAALIAERLGLRYFSRADAHALRNKARMRSRLAAAGVPCPPFRSFSGDLQRDLQHVGLPAVLKPIAGYSSIDVVKIESPSDVPALQDRLQKANGSPDASLGTGYLVESFIPGGEWSVESLVQDGRVVFDSVTYKVKGPQPWFEELGHTVGRELPQGLRDEVRQVVFQALRALGVRDGATHSELRLSSNGPVVIEIAGRLAGDKIPHLTEVATGVDLSASAARLALGDAAPLVRRPVRPGATSIAFFVPTHTQTLRRLPIAPPEVPGLVEYYFGATPGRHAVAPEKFFTRLGYVITHGRTPDDTESAADAAIDQVARNTGMELIRVFTDGVH